MTPGKRDILRLFRGDVTPFLAAPWDEAEHEIVGRFLAGEGLAGSTDRFAAAVGDDTSDIVPLNLGRAAIQVALASAGLPRDSEVMLPSFSCRGVIAPVLQAGFHPTLVDVDDELNPDLEAFESARGPGTAALIVPHLAGVPCRDLDAIVEWAAGEGLIVIEDRAQRLTVDRTLAPGVFAAVYSCGPGKPLFGLYGGWVQFHRGTTLPEDISPADNDDSSRALRDFVKRFASGPVNAGRSRLRSMTADFVSARLHRATSQCASDRFDVTRMTEVAAAIAICQLSKLDGMIQQRRANADRWRRLLGRTGTWRLAPDSLENTYTKFWVLETDGLSQTKGRLRASLWSHGVETEDLYVPLHRRVPFDRHRRGNLSRTEGMWRSLYSLPARPSLSERDWTKIEQAVMVYSVGSS